jgi:hypothetical protein
MFIYTATAAVVSSCATREQLHLAVQNGGRVWIQNIDPTGTATLQVSLVVHQINLDIVAIPVCIHLRGHAVA